MSNFQKEYGESDLLDNYLNQAIGETLRELREQHNLSYAELAKKLGNIVSRQTLNNYELAKSKLRVNMFIELAKVYNLTTKELYEKINYRYIGKLSKYTEQMLEQENKKNKQKKHGG